MWLILVAFLLMSLGFNVLLVWMHIQDEKNRIAEHAYITDLVKELVKVRKKEEACPTRGS